MSDAPAISVKDLVVSKQGQPICRVPELSVGAGETVVVRGTNGSGKSTLLRVIAGLEREFDGTCNVQVGSEQIGFVQQTPIMFRGTVDFNLEYGLRARNVPVDGRLGQLTTAFGLDSLRDHNARTLSGGEKRRVALVRAIALAPKLLLLDEPLSDLDDDGVAHVISALAGDALKKTTVLIASPIDLPADLSARTAVLGG